MDEIEEGREDFDTLGELLRHLRTTYADRLGRNRPAGPVVTLTALSLIRCLSQHGYPITSGAYSELESGNTLPRDPRRFFTALCTCLGIDEDSKYWWILRQQYGYDLLARSIGPEEAGRLVPHGTAGLRYLKELDCKD